MRPLKASTGLVCLLGYPVEHSRSPEIHNAAFAAAGSDLVYLAFAVPPDLLAAAVEGIRALGLRGANVTVPHKQAVMEHIDAVDQLAARIGAVNTIVNRNGCLKGYNTDSCGFLTSLTEQGFNPQGKNVLVLGAGGAARAITFALLEAGCKRLIIANRKREKAEALAAALAAYGVSPEACSLTGPELAARLPEVELVVNATSVGMWPEQENTPLPPSWLQAGQWVYDLVYTPRETRLLREARQRGCHTLSGLSMLLHQGAKAFELWTGVPAPLAVMRQVLERSEK
ncbi:MAG: shikimate dehydrogenase [Clostridia bacterium]|nr:shikimate dehydrogenase [Clostridia bacterium]